jgi:hypothetical protein
VLHRGTAEPRQLPPSLRQGPRPFRTQEISAQLQLSQQQRFQGHQGRRQSDATFIADLGLPKIEETKMRSKTISNVRRTHIAKWVLSKPHHGHRLERWCQLLTAAWPNSIGAEIKRPGFA